MAVSTFPPMTDCRMPARDMAASGAAACGLAWLPARDRHDQRDRHDRRDREAEAKGRGTGGVPAVTARAA
ncbi:hypothetical protein WS91_10120 [Burkholderia sp. MSMB1498]|nr:hypothetical protein WS91_10120 [Burkholderia sp. MSMB1498]